MKLQRIRDLREDHDLTQFKMAELLGVKRTTYAMWELGDVDFPIEKIIFLAEYFKTNIQYLVGLTNDKGYFPHPTIISQKELGRRLRSFRLSRGLTQKQMAISLGINQSSYAYYEYGTTGISTHKLFLLSNTFRVNLDELLK